MKLIYIGEQTEQTEQTEQIEQTEQNRMFTEHTMYFFKFIELSYQTTYNIYSLIVNWVWLWIDCLVPRQSVAPRICRSVSLTARCLHS